MSSLPDEFERDDDEASLSLQDPAPEAPIRFEQHERTVPTNVPSKKASSGIALPIAMLSLLLSVMVLCVAVEHPAQKISSMFGGKKPTENVDIAELKTQLDKLNSAVVDLSNQAGQAVNGLHTVTQTIDSLRAQITEGEARDTNLENRLIQINSKVEAFNTRPAPKPVAVKPKEPVKPTVLVNVVSIRTQGGILWASLREGLDTSPLLSVGDEWHNVKVVSIDQAARGVQIAANGAITTVRL